MHLISRVVAIAVACLTVALAGAQMMAPNYSGTFLVDNQPYQGGPILWFSLARIAAGGMNPATSAVWLAPEPDTVGNTDGRTMMKFTAGGTGNLSGANWWLPSDSDGNMTTAAHKDSRIFSTWTPGWCISPENNHIFASQVSYSGSGGQAWVDIDVQEAPHPYMVSSQGAFSHDFLDNNGFDQDPNNGQILIDKNATPTLQLSYTMPSFLMHRDVVHWQDGTESNSSFYDMAMADMWVVFDGQDGEYIFRGPNSVPIYFDAGEDAADKTIAAFGGTMAFNISGIKPGDYKVHYWAVPWTADYTNANHDLGCASGFIAIENFESHVRVVPEPATILGLISGIGGIGALRRRRIASRKRYIRHSP